MEIFADNLPGLPDNIRRCSKGGYWVGTAVCRYGDIFSMYDFAANKPWLRRLAATVSGDAIIVGCLGFGGDLVTYNALIYTHVQAYITK